MIESAKLPTAVMIFGCGYTGTALAQYLMQVGVRVGALTRNSEQAARLRAMGVPEVVEADLEDAAWHSQLQGDYTALINCVSSAGGGLAGYEKSYVKGQQAILNWTQGRGIQTYIYTSSTSVYPQDGGVDVEESADTSLAPETGKLLLQSEQLIAAAATQFERWYVFRLAGIYGPQRHYLLNQLRESAGVMPGRGNYTMNLIHRDDIIGALVRALSQPTAESGIYNLADDGATHKAEMAAWLAIQLGVKPPRFDPALSSPRLLRRGGRMPDRRILNAKVKAAFDWSPKYCDFRAGYQALLEGCQESPLNR